jgi:hypothetical protein
MATAALDFGGQGTRKRLLVDHMREQMLDKAG